MGAERHFADILAKDPRRADALAWRARWLMSMDRHTQAMPDLDKAIELAPEPGWAYQLRAEARIIANDIDGCLKDLKCAREWPEHGIEADVLLPWAHVIKGDLDTALKCLDEAISNWGIDKTVGVFWAFAEDVPVEEHLPLVQYGQEILSKSKDFEWVALVLGYAFFRFSELEEAALCFERAKKAYPDAKLPPERLAAAKAEAAKLATK